MKDFLFWKNCRRKKARRRSGGVSVTQKLMARLKFYFYGERTDDSSGLQPALADRSFILFSALSGEDVSTRQLPPKFLAPTRMVRRRSSVPACRAKIAMVARSACRVIA